MRPSRLAPMRFTFKDGKSHIISNINSFLALPAAWLFGQYHVINGKYDAQILAPRRGLLSRLPLAAKIVLSPVLAVLGVVALITGFLRLPFLAAAKRIEKKRYAAAKQILNPVPQPESPSTKQTAQNLVRLARAGDKDGLHRALAQYYADSSNPKLEPRLEHWLSRVIQAPEDQPVAARLLFPEAWALPVIEHQEKWVGSTDYIDSMPASALTAPIMQGTDQFGRAYVAMNVDKADQGKATVFFQRYSDDKHTWAVAGKTHVRLQDQTVALPNTVTESPEAVLNILMATEAAEQSARAFTPARSSQQSASDEVVAPPPVTVTGRRVFTATY